MCCVTPDSHAIVSQQIRSSAGAAEDVVCTGKRTADERNAELRAEAVPVDDAE